MPADGLPSADRLQSAAALPLSASTDVNFSEESVTVPPPRGKWRVLQEAA